MLVDIGGATPEREGFLKELGLLLVQARIERGWTPGCLAARLRLPVRQVVAWETTGYMDATLEILSAVVEALDFHSLVRIDPR